MVHKELLCTHSPYIRDLCATAQSYKEMIFSLDSLRRELATSVQGGNSTSSNAEVSRTPSPIHSILTCSTSAAHQAPPKMPHAVPVPLRARRPPQNHQEPNPRPNHQRQKPAPGHQTRTPARRLLTRAPDLPSTAQREENRRSNP